MRLCDISEISGPSFLVSRKIANCAAFLPPREGGDKETKVYAGYVFYVYSIARPLESFMTPAFVDGKPGFFLCTFQFCRKVSARLQPTSPRTSRQPLFIGPRFSLIIVNPGISPPRERERESAREYSRPRYLFSTDNAPSKTNGLDNYWRINKFAHRGLTGSVE